MLAQTVTPNEPRSKRAAMPAWHGPWSDTHVGGTEALVICIALRLSKLAARDWQRHTLTQRDHAIEAVALVDLARSSCASTAAGAAARTELAARLQGWGDITTTTSVIDGERRLAFVFGAMSPGGSTLHLGCPVRELASEIAARQLADVGALAFRAELALFLSARLDGSTLSAIDYPKIVECIAHCAAKLNFPAMFSGAPDPDVYARTLAAVADCLGVSICTKRRIRTCTVTVASGFGGEVFTGAFTAPRII